MTMLRRRPSARTASFVLLVFVICVLVTGSAATASETALTARAFTRGSPSSPHVRFSLSTILAMVSRLGAAPEPPAPIGMSSPPSTPSGTFWADMRKSRSTRPRTSTSSSEVPAILWPSSFAKL